MRRPDARLEHRPFAAAEIDRCLRIPQRRLGQHVEHAVGRVRPVERRPGAQHHLDPLEVLVGRRNEVEQVHPQGWHAGQAIVRENVEGAREDVVEAANDHIGGLNSLADDVHARRASKMVHDGRRRTVRDLSLTDRNRRVGGLRRLLRLSSARYNDSIQLEYVGCQHHVEGRGRSGPYSDGIRDISIAQIRKNDRVRARRHAEPELARWIAESASTAA